MKIGNLLDEIGIADALSYEVLTLENTSITVLNLIVVLVILIATYFVSKLVQRALSKALGSSTPEQEAARKTTNRLVHYMLLLVGLGIAASTLGLNLSALLAASAVFAVGIGFAIQNILENFFSGLVLMFDRSIRPGDIIKIEGDMVRVRDIRVRTTTVMNLDGDEYIVPNSVLAQSTVKNMSVPKRGHRIHASVGVHYESDLDVVFEALTKAAEEFPGRIEEKEPLVLLQEFGSSSVNFDVFIWIASAWSSPRVRSKLMKVVWDALAAADVVIAYPQIDVHFDESAIERLMIRPGGKRRKGQRGDGSNEDDGQRDPDSAVSEDSDAAQRSHINVAGESSSAGQRKTPKPPRSARTSSDDERMDDDPVVGETPIENDRDDERMDDDPAVDETPIENDRDDERMDDDPAVDETPIENDRDDERMDDDPVVRDELAGEANDARRES